MDPLEQLLGRGGREHLMARFPQQSGGGSAGSIGTPPVALTGTPTTGEAVVATSPTTADWAAVAGGVTSVFTRTGAVVATTGDYTVAKVTGAAPLASPALTGVPTAPTAAALTNTTQLATTAFDTAAVAVETTRAEAAEALLAPLASPALTGTPTAPTAAPGDDSTTVATTAFVDAAIDVVETTFAPLASPALTGTPTAPTGTPGDASTQIATDAFVATAVAAGLIGSPLNQLAPTETKWFKSGGQFGPINRFDASCGTTSGSATVTDAAAVAGRTDTATYSNASSVITDASIGSGDTGKTVLGANIPYPAYVGTVTAGVSFVLSSTNVAGQDTPVNPTGSGSSVTLGSDIGSLVTGPGIPFPAYIGSVVNATSFALSSSPSSNVALTATANGTVTLSIGEVFTYFSDSGAGMIRNLWLAMGAGHCNLTNLLAITYDGGTTPQILVDLQTLFLMANDGVVGGQSETLRTSGTAAVAGAGNYTVTHGLGSAIGGATPTQVLALPAGAFAASEWLQVSAVSTTTFTLGVGGAYTGNVYWEAIGLPPTFASTQHMSVQSDGNITGQMQFPIPYSGGVVIQLMNTGDASFGLDLAYLQVQYLKGITAPPYRLYSTNIPWSPGAYSGGKLGALLPPSTNQTNGTKTLANISVSTNSWLIWVGECFQAGRVDICSLTSGSDVVTDPSISSGRTDTAVYTNASNVITDASITTADQGKPCIGANIPAHSYVGTVTVSTSFLLSSTPDTQTNVSPTGSGSAVTIGSDQGKPVTGSGGIVGGFGYNGIPVGTFVGTVTNGVSFLLSSSATSQVNVNATATGTLVGVAIGGYNNTYMERNHALFVDGEGTASIQSSGVEDFFQGGFYFSTLSGYSTPTTMLTTGSNPDYTYNIGLDLLQLFGGVLFTSELKIVLDIFASKAATVTTGCTMSFVGLYYSHT